jgi:carbonic anhydrase
MNRRDSISLFAGALATPLLSRAQNPAQLSAPMPTPSPAPIPAALAAYRTRLDDATPQSVLTWLKAGNDRFRVGRSSQGEQANDARARLTLTGSNGQRGIAVVVSCIDSRVPPELVLDAAIGDLYTVRIGANVIGEDALGSVEVAVASDAKIVLVMGHTRCAGVRAACGHVELEHFTQLLAKVQPAIGRAQSALDKESAKASEIGERSPGNHKYVSFVSHHNARWQAEQVLVRSQTVRDAVSKGTTWVIPALYDIETGAVAFDAPLSLPKAG